MGFDVDIYEESESTYLGIEIAKSNNSEFRGIIPDSDNYEDEIDHIEIPHERTRQPDEPLAEDEHAILR